MVHYNIWSVIVFEEDVHMASFCFHFLKLPFKISETGLTEGPGGSDYNDRYYIIVM